MIIFPTQNPADRFVTTPKALFEDPAISWKAKGMIAWLASHSAQYTFHVSTLIKYSKEGRDSVYSGLKEICSSAYGRKVQERTDDGTFGKSHYLISSEPHTADEWQAMIDGLEFDVLEKSEHKGEKLTRNGKPAYGEIEAHAEKPATPGFDTGSGFSAHGADSADFPTATDSGKTVSGFSDTKKIKSKKIKTTTTEPGQILPSQENHHRTPTRPSQIQAPETGIDYLNRDGIDADFHENPDDWAQAARHITGAGLDVGQEWFKFTLHNSGMVAPKAKWLLSWMRWDEQAGRYQQRGTKTARGGVSGGRVGWEAQQEARNAQAGADFVSMMQNKYGNNQN